MRVGPGFNHLEVCKSTKKELKEIPYTGLFEGLSNHKFHFDFQIFGAPIKITPAMVASWNLHSQTNGACSQAWEKFWRGHLQHCGDLFFTCAHMRHCFWIVWQRPSSRKIAPTHRIHHNADFFYLCSFLFLYCCPLDSFFLLSTFVSFLTRGNCSGDSRLWKCCATLTAGRFQGLLSALFWIQTGKEGKAKAESKKIKATRKWEEKVISIIWEYSNNSPRKTQAWV